MQLDGMIEGRLLRRYKRFLADVELLDGRQVTAHCPNTGSMKHCAEPGSRVWLMDSGNPKRKYPLGWELVEIDQQFLCCINTGRANKLIKEAIVAGVVAELQGYDHIRQEVKYGENSRIDLLLETDNRPPAYVEIKNLTLLEDNGWGSFPDAVTTRGAKHLKELMMMVEQGYRAVMLFCVPHAGIRQVRPADEIDPVYGQLLRQAEKAGVEVLAYGATLTESEVKITHPLPIQL